MQTQDSSTGRTVIRRLFTELFRPSTLDAAIVLPRISEVLSKGLTNNIIFYGKAGSGKTTLTRILADEKHRQVLNINCSLETGVDTIREQVIGFASSASLFGNEDTMRGNDKTIDNYKIIVLEECDFLSINAWASLRATIEKYEKRVRFIANCNYVNKIPAPILSRFLCIPIDPQDASEEQFLSTAYQQRIAQILSYLKIGYTPEQVLKIVATYGNDMRSILNLIQSLYNRGCTELTDDAVKPSFEASGLIQMVMTPQQPWDNYKYLIAEWQNRADDGVLALGRDLPKYIHEYVPDKEGKIPAIIIIICEHQAMLPTAIDKFIVLSSLCFKLQSVLNS